MTRAAVIAAAMRLVEEHGVEALTMRRLAEELGVAVTAIYWHIGNRDTLVDLLLQRLLEDMGRIKPRGRQPRTRITSIARVLRAGLLARPHLIALADQRGKTAAMFQPAQAALAAELAAVGLRGRPAAVVIQAVQCHIVASVVLARALSRSHTHDSTDPQVWPDAPDDPQLVAALARPPDLDRVFELGLQALLDGLLAD
ncbi:MAG TPA: helix-turn-helix domain-containing protein [Mycobacteriales bacterium]|nr:helix-turn-helix domain-containing protein [Mycobacteriales bacterium]